MKFFGIASLVFAWAKPYLFFIVLDIKNYLKQKTKSITLKQFHFGRRSSMRLIGNVIWVVFGGFFVALEYLIASVLLIVTIIGIPFGLQSIKLAWLALWPFGKKVITTDTTGGCLAIVMNILWILLGGIWISLSHLLFGILFAITIIGIPFAKQHFKLASLALTPFGKEVVTK